MPSCGYPAAQQLLCALTAAAPQLLFPVTAAEPLLLFPVTATESLLLCVLTAAVSLLLFPVTAGQHHGSYAQSLLQHHCSHAQLWSVLQQHKSTTIDWLLQSQTQLKAWLGHCDQALGRHSAWGGTWAQLKARVA